MVTVEGGGGRSEPGLHTLSFSWLDGHIWVRVYRNAFDEAGVPTDVQEVGPRIVLRPMRIVASGFGGAILHATS